MTVAESNERLVELGELDELVRHVDRLVDAEEWDGLVDLRRRCRAALERGKQLWPAASLAEYRLANYDAAARPARRAIDLNPFHFTYYELMGSIFVKLGQQECLETGDALEPLLGNAPEAKEQLEQVCEG